MSFCGEKMGDNKLKGGNKKMLKKIIMFILIFGMCISKLNLPIYAQNCVNLDEESEISISNEEQNIEKQTESSSEKLNNEWDEVPNQQIYEGENYEITFNLQEEWDSGFIARVEIKNIGFECIENWTLGIDFQATIASVWDAEIDFSIPGKYVIKNAGWNEDINIGESIEFGIRGDGAFGGFPTDYEMLARVCDLNEDDYKINYNIVSSWEDSFNANISILNSTNEDLNDWFLEFDFDADITAIWNGEIIYKSNNHYVIKNAGYNSTFPSKSMVHVGIEACYKDAICDPSNFKLYSYLSNTENYLKDNSEDKEIVENAYSKLEIGYAEGDDENSITNDVFLCTNLEGTTISWISDKPGVVSDDGKVTRSKETNFVCLTASIRSNEYIMNKDFTVRVVKNTYSQYDVDCIYDMDSLELLYAYNDNIDDLEVYLNEEGYISELNGKFSEFIVESPQEALLALCEVKSLMGCNSPQEQLVWDKTSKDNYGFSYKFHQVVDGISVYGNSVVVSTDLRGVTTALHSSFVTDISIDLDNVISEADIRRVTEKEGYKFVSLIDLVVYKSDKVHLTYNVSCTKNEELYNLLVDANGGNVVLINALTQKDEVLHEKGKDLLGNSQTFYVNKQKDKKHKGKYLYTIHDYTRNIRYYDLKGSSRQDQWPGESIIKKTNTWTAGEISAMVSMNKVFDYYYQVLGRQG